MVLILAATLANDGDMAKSLYMSFFCSSKPATFFRRFSPMARRFRQGHGDDMWRRINSVKTFRRFFTVGL